MLQTICTAFRSFPRRCLKKKQVALTVIGISFLVGFFKLLTSLERKMQQRISSENCVCLHRGIRQDFCYHLPENRSVHGKRMDCRYADILHSLGLLENENGQSSGSAYVDTAKELPEPAMVTAFSESHFSEGIRLIATIRRFWPVVNIIVYDIGLSEKSVKRISSLCHVEYRKFNFSDYPPHVKKIFEFRWKPLIIAEVLNEYGALWYMDSSVIFKKGDLEHVYDLVRCRKEGRGSQPALPSIEDRDRREWKTPHESSWDRIQWMDNIAECRKSPYLLHGYTGHGIFPATSPGVYEFFPTNFGELKKPKAKMYEAGLVYAVRTAEVVRDILRWYAACALEASCMGNSSTVTLACFFEGDRFSKYAKCHRYDQAIINLLCANAYHYDRHYYVSEIVDFFNIVRGHGQPISESQLLCNGTRFTGTENPMKWISL